MSRRVSSTLSIDLAGGAAVLAILAASGVLGIAPATRLKSVQTARYDEMETLREETRATLEEMRRLDADAKRDAEEARAQQLTLLSASELNARLAGLIAKTEAAGLEVLTITPGEAVKDDMHGRTPVDIAVRGALPEVVRYLHALRTGSADLVVRRLDIRPHGQGPLVTTQIGADWLTRAD